MFHCLPIGGKVDARYAEIVSAPDETRRESEGLVVGVDGLFAPIAVS